MGSLLAVFLVTGCRANQNPPPPTENNGVETPGTNNNLHNNVTPEEDVAPGVNNFNNGDRDIIEDENERLNRERNINNNNTDLNNNRVTPGGTGAGGTTGTGGMGTGGK